MLDLRTSKKEQEAPKTTSVCSATLCRGLLTLIDARPDPFATKSEESAGKYNSMHSRRDCWCQNTLQNEDSTSKIKAASQLCFRLLRL
jgi:hypothetical protein